MSKVWDAVIIGAGPAGASCAVWLRQLGFDPLLLEASDCVGGLAARNPFPDVWTVTSPNHTGVEVAQQIGRQVAAAGIDLWLNARVTAVRQALVQGRSVQDNSGPQPESERPGDGTAPAALKVDVERPGLASMQVPAKTLVIASGVIPRGLPGYEGQALHGVIVGPGDNIMSTSFDGARVAILGGGDNAFENYAFVKQRQAVKVDLYARRVRAQRQFVAAVPPEDLHLGSVTVDPHARQVNGQSYDLILVFYGWQPNVGFLGDFALTLDDRGFIWTDPVTAQTSVPNVYAIGEVAQRMHPCVPTAMADGVVAAKSIEKLLAQD